MQSLVHSNIFSKFFLHLVILSFSEVLRLTSVEHLTKHIIRFTTEANRFAKSASYNFAEELVFNTVIKEDWATFNIK